MRGLLWLGLAACGGEVGIDQIESTLNADERRARCEAIRDVARDRGLTNGVVLGGIGDSETNLAHCWSEATWACMGPDSSSCGGPVIAGAGDGPCADQQGGLGLFQFDGGTFDQTLARDGEEILLLEGNISHAVDFVLGMVQRSVYVDINSEADALAWINSIPIEPGNSDYEAWISTVTHYYNGCQPTFACWDERRGRYESMTRGVYEEMGADFWMAPPPQPCLPLPAEGGIIDDTDSCYDDGGPIGAWRTVDVGYGGRLRWTYAWEQPTENYAYWNIDLAAEGMYRVEVHTDADYAKSKQARYTINHAGAADQVVLDQTAMAGFQHLGDFFFAAGGGQSVYLEDNTGEPLADQITLAFDAIRVTPVEDPPPSLVPVPVRPKVSVEPDQTMEKPDDMMMMTMGGEMIDDGGGCACVRPRGVSSLAWLLLGLTASRRVRRSLARSARA